MSGGAPKLVPVATKSSAPFPKRSSSLIPVEDDDDGTPKAPGGTQEDATVAAGIRKYFDKQESTRKQGPTGRLVGAVIKPEEEEHTGITDDEAGPDEDEDEYDVVSRQSLKASSEAFFEVLSEVQSMKLAGKEAESKLTGK